MRNTTRTAPRARRHRRIRTRVRGTAERPRLSVFRSSRHLFIQLINDDAQRTLLGISDVLLPSAHRTRGKAGSGGGLSRRVARAFALGKLLAERAQAQGVARAVFDRGGYLYHGRVKAVADGARAGGLQL